MHLGCSVAGGRAYIGIGLPGSGKTSYLKKLATDIGAVYVCADDVRAEWYGDASVQSNPSLIWKEVHRRARKALMSGRDVVVDGSHVKPEDRKQTILACQDAKRIEARWCQAPFQVCMERNLARERVVPAYAMKRMRNQLYRNPPSRLEGFHRIIRINTAVLE